MVPDPTVETSAQHHRRPRRRRRSPGWVPNQHGAWAMLAAPLLVGILASGPAWVHLPLAAFWFSGYLAFFATSLWLKSRRRARWFPPVRAYGLASLLLGLVVVLVQPGLVVWAPAFGPPLAVGLWAAAARHERDLLAGLTSVLASCLIAVVAYDAGTTGSLERGWLLAIVQLLYFAGTVFYVKTVIRERDNRPFHALSVAVHLAAVGVVALLPVDGPRWPLVAVFALLAVRAAAVPAWRPTPKQVGIAEIFATVAVSVVSLLVV